MFEGDAAEKDKYVLFVYIIAGELHLHIHRIIIQIVLKLIHPFSFSRISFQRFGIARVNISIIKVFKRRQSNHPL